MVSAHTLASEAGASVLRKGGNAVDAAVATSLMLGVVEPAFSGIGGGGFALLRMNDGRSLALDYRETAPLASTPGMFSDGSDKNRIGPLAIATPGLLAGHLKLLEDYGTMNFADLAAPAIEVAKSGIKSVTLSQQMLKDRASFPSKKINRFRWSSRIYDGKTKFPLLAKTLDRLTIDGPSEFYRGHIPETFSRYVKEIGGILTEEDFERYAPKERKPVTGEYMGYDLLSMPPPSAGGALLIHGLQAAEELSTQWREHLPLSTVALLRVMLREKGKFGDPEFVETPVASLVSRRAAKKAAESIGFRDGRLHLKSRHDTGSTSHFSVVDRKGNVVAATETIECYYGSGVTIPGLGIVANDEMHDFDVTPGRPNSVAPMKRPASSMTPTIVLKGDVPFLVLGGAGSERIISSAFQTVRNIVEGGMSLARAVASPRVHFAGDRVEIEGGNPKGVVSELSNAGFSVHLRPRRDAYFGGVHAIMIEGSGEVSGAADPRRKGAVAAA